MHIYKPNCKCEKDKKCKCGAKWGYLVDVGINPTTGKRKQKFKGGFKTKKEAEAAASLFKLEVSDGSFVEDKNITFQQYTEQWLKWYESTGKVKVSTIRVRKHEIGRMSPYFSKLIMRRITKKQYQAMLNTEKEKGSADNTLDGIHGTGRMIFKKAMEEDVIKTDPTQYAYVPKLQKTIEDLEKDEEPEKYMEKDELVEFLHAAKWKGLERDHLIFYMLAYTGIRAGELCALKWTDIDFDELTINITKTYYNPNNNVKEYKLLPPKTPSSKRVIAIDKDLIDILEQHKAIQNKIKMRYRDTYYDKDFVIAKLEKTRGYPEYVKTIENRMRRLLKYAGIEAELTPHSLRHTHTSLLAAAGIPLHEIMERLGHKDDEVTKHVYLHVTKDRKKEAPLGISEILRGATVK